MKDKKKDKYGTGNIIDDFPHLSDNYRDHRTFIYTMGKAKERKGNSMIQKEVWSVVQWQIKIWKEKNNGLLFNIEMLSHLE